MASLSACDEDKITISPGEASITMGFQAQSPSSRSCADGTPTIDLQNSILKAARELVPVLLAIWGRWWGFPLLFRKALNNEGGEIICADVKTEIETQPDTHSARTKVIVDLAIRKHG